MSSRRKKNQGENNGSNRNLDGRRLRTVNEAKALAEYLALKPEMEKKEKDARRKRWEQVVELAERREAEIRDGSKGRVDGKWVEDKEEAAERTREAVLAAMKSGNYKDNLLGTLSGSPEGSSASACESNDGEDAEDSSSKATTPPSASKPIYTAGHKFFGFDDDDDEFMSDEEDGSEDEIEETSVPKDSALEGKGKGRA